MDFFCVVMDIKRGVQVMLDQCVVIEEVMVWNLFDN